MSSKSPRRISFTLTRVICCFVLPVLSVFQPLSAGGSESEQTERSAKLRSQLDVFVSNLCEPTSLSLLLAALVRIWSLLKVTIFPPLPPPSLPSSVSYKAGFFLLSRCRNLTPKCFVSSTHTGQQQLESKQSNHLTSITSTSPLPPSHPHPSTARPTSVWSTCSVASGPHSL